MRRRENRVAETEVVGMIHSHEGRNPDCLVLRRKLQPVKFLALVLLIFLATGFFNNDAEAANGRVVIIDGVQILSVLNPDYQPNPTAYLRDAIDSYWSGLIGDRIGQIEQFYWTRNMDDTTVTVQILSARLEQISNEIQAANAALVIVGHSWGSVFAYEAIKNNNNIKVDKLITLGSPLNAQDQTVNSFTKAELSEALIQQVDSLPNVRVWQNYWATCDPISGSIAAANSNHQIEPAILDNLFGTCHSGYYEDYSEWQKILLDVYITQPPLAISYDPQLPSAPANINFNATGSLTSNSNASYSWDFGDGQTANGKSVNNYYKQPGYYTVTLTMTDGSGPHVVTESVQINPPPINVTRPDGCEAKHIHFSTTDYGSLVTEYTWNYGDGTPPETGRSQEHTYANEGSYNVMLVLTLANGGAPISNVQPIYVGSGTQYISAHTIYGEETWSCGSNYVVDNVSVANGGKLTIQSGGEC